MTGTPAGETSAAARAFAEFAATCLFLDIETTEDGGVRTIGAVLGDREFARPDGPGNVRDVRRALEDLDRFAADARTVAGHNLIRHDVPHLRAAWPALRLLGLPAIDTLVLSPLAFPRRPYHQLVKDYKLVRDEKSHALADARLAKRLLADEWDAFAALHAAAAERADVMRSCLDGWQPAGGGGSGKGGAAEAPAEGPSASGTASVLERIGARRLDDAAVVETAGRLVAGRVCGAAWRAAAERVLSDAGSRPALAYAVEWILVAETRSVLPRWVASAFPAVVPLLRAVREEPCGSDACAWCAEVHSPRRALAAFFGFDGFRGPPCGDAGLPMQEEVVRLGMAGRPLLAILPTSFGKSLCYQLPALVRHRRRGTLTVVISPLQALMKDQVDVLEARVHGRYAAAIQGMLTPPERGEVLAQVRDGSLALLYVAPEQLRNRSFRSAVRARQIGAWVFDEAHCVSKWGHDFRTDYRYAARFIREFSRAEGVDVAPVACFTATAKRDVRDDIVDHFRAELGMDLTVVEAPVHRENLSFAVREVTESEKFAALDEELHARLDDTPGCAIVYLATRRRTEEAARHLAGRGWSCEAFHAGVDVPRKREIQEAFQRGDLRVICATNAFGMGIDKPDVRLVLHADVPGSLENYIQEAGRAGRDGLPSRCVLLWNPADLDVQFGLLARSQLTQRDIGQILRAIRRARRGDRDDVVVTARELLHDDRTEVSFDADDRDARTKVATAISWLERAELVERDENHTRVFQGRPKVRDMAEAKARVEALDLSAGQRERWLRILHALMTADERQGLDLDELAEATGMHAWKDDDRGARPVGRRSPALLLLSTLRDMAQRGLVDEGLALSAFVRVGIVDAAADRFAVLAALEDAFLDALRECAPDAEPGEAWHFLDLRAANEILRSRGQATSTEVLRRVLHSLAEDGRGLADARGSIALAHAGGDRYRVRLQRSWDAIVVTARLRRSVAEHALAAIVEKAASTGLGRGEVLVAFGMNELLEHLARVPAVASRVQDHVAALERALLFLHEQRVLTLQKGLAVFRQAMGLRLVPESRGRPYTAGDYADLRFHYRERVHQAHAMGEYARLAVIEPRRAADLVIDYFSAPWSEFVARWFAGRDEEIGRATSREAYRRIVEDLRNATQQRIVASSSRQNLLVLAGPGSGKTRVVVHRCAYLLLVERVPPTAILVLCFNRAACHELRVRLRALAGRAAAGVQVHTYHGLALRLTGRSLARRAQEPSACDAPPFDFDALIDDAVRLLRGETPVAGFEPDALRDRLLAGYEHVLVDEYQDVNRAQYELIGELAGRRGTGGERGEPASLLAVGDDDQNIYEWRGADVSFLRQFKEDYRAREEYLVENFRSTAHIVAAANALIGPNPARMKASKPLRVDKARRDGPRGGRVAQHDRVSGGRVQIVDVPDRSGQVASVFGEIERLRLALGGAEFADFAVLAREHRELDAFRAWCDVRGVPCRRAAGPKVMPPLHHVREIALAADRVRDLGSAMVTVASLGAALALPPDGDVARDPWTALVVRALNEWAEEIGDDDAAAPEGESAPPGPPTAESPPDAAPSAPASAFLEFLHEFLAEQRRGQVVGHGVFLGTVHSAKGLEFPHVFVLDGGWCRVRDDEVEATTRLEARTPESRAAEERRVYFVAMTRARDSLHLLRRADAGNPFVDELAAAGGSSVRVRAPEGSPSSPPEILTRHYTTLSLGDVDLGYAGRRESEAPVHRHIDALRTGHNVTLRAEPGRIVLVDAAGRVVGALSAAARQAWEPRLAADEILEARVFALLRRDRSLAADAFRESVHTDAWEVPLVEIVTRTRAVR